MTDGRHIPDPQNSSLTTAAELLGNYMAVYEVGSVTSHVQLPDHDGEHVMVVAVRLHGSVKPEAIIQRMHTALVDMLASKS